MASKFGYRLTNRAESDLDEIVRYIAVELANPQAASDFVDNLQAHIEEARSFPEMEEKLIYVLRIVYGKRNMDEILKKLDIS